MIGRDDVQDIYPLTPFQEGILFHDRMDQLGEAGDVPAQRAYFQQLVFRIHGALDVEVFEQSWQRLVARHDILRTIFRASGPGRPVQIVLKRRPFALEMRDLQVHSPPDREVVVREFIANERRHPFDLMRGPLMRVTCLMTGPLETVVVWSFHHILFDGWCIGILQEELSASYAALAKGDPFRHGKAPAFARFVKWSEQRRGGPVLDYWADYLNDWEPGLEIPVIRAGAGTGERKALSRRVRFDRDLMRRVTALARSQKLTMNTVIVALWGLFLARLNQIRDVVVGAVVSTRPAELDGADRMIGPCIAMVPARVRFAAGESAAAVLRRFQEQSADWLANCHVSLADIQARVRCRGLFSHYVAFENYPLDAGFRGERQVFAPGLMIGQVESVLCNSYDFNLTCQPEGEELVLDFHFNGAVVDAADVDDLASRFLVLVRAVADAPEASVEALPLMTPEERQIVTDVWSRGPTAAASAGTVAELRRRVVAQHGARPALRTGERTLTHRQLQDRADTLARHLRLRHGCAAGSTVAVIAAGGLPFVQAVLACLSLGAAFVPLDPAAPRARNAHILADCGAGMILADDPASLGGLAGDRPVLDLGIFDRDPESEPAIDPPPPVPANAPAYVIYTSGTTGSPKGVRVSQGALANYVGWLARDLGIGPGDATALVTSPAFDLGYTGVFGTLLLGGCLTLLSEDERRDPASVCTAIVDHRLTFLKATPSYLSMLLADPRHEALADAKDLRLLLLGGEVQDFEALRRLRALCPGAALWNHYGPTEATIGCVAGPLCDLLDCADPPQRLGRPIAGTRVLLVDGALRPVPPGIPGEIMVLGAGLADGYVGHAAADDGKFVALPWLAGARAYRTGDRARWLPDGTIGFLGRRDDQVKIRGYRVALSEVESALHALPVVQDAAVRAVRGPRTTELVAYLVPEPGTTPTVRGLRVALAEVLPDAMVPSRFVLLSRMPLTTNGKIDRAALERHEGDSRLLLGVAVAGEGPESIGSETEEALRAIWKEVLFVERVGLDNDFFDLGGHSIKAVMMVARLRKLLNRSLPIRRVFDHPTPRLLAAFLDARDGENPGTAGVAMDNVPVDGVSAETAPRRPRLDLLLSLRRGTPEAPTVVFLPPIFGTSSVYKEMIDRMDADITCVGLQCPGFDGDEPFVPSMENLADHFAAVVQSVQPEGRIRLVGYSMGAHVALELALRLEDRGRDVRLVLIDAAPRTDRHVPDPLEPNVESLAALRSQRHWTRILDFLVEGMEGAVIARLEKLLLNNLRSLQAYAFVGRLRADITCIEALDNPKPADMMGFGALTSGRCLVHRVTGNHYTLFQPPNVNGLEPILRHAVTA